MTSTFRFQLPASTPLRPFAITGPTGAEYLRDTGVRVVDATQPENRAFALAMNRGNCLAYDGLPHPGTAAGSLGMPRWVMLDCCALPSAIFGYEAPRDAIPADVADAMDPDGGLEWIGVSEYIALPTLRPAELVGVSLFSLVAGQRLGVRTKALTLRLLSAETQTGVTQWTGAGVKLHLEFGPLEIVSTAVAVHDRPDETFIYRVALPPRSVLERIEDGHRPSWAEPDGETWSVDPRNENVGAALAARGGRTWIVGAGSVSAGGLDRLDFVTA